MDKFYHIFFLGIKGVAMANLAVILKKMEKKVFGYDLKEEFITDKLLIKNQINWQSDSKNLPKDIDLFVYSAAHEGNKNYLTQLALKRKIKIITQPELIQEIMKSFKNKIAICGCHGKTTTSCLLAYCLIKLNKKPSYLVGTPFFNNFNGGNFSGKKDYFVVEADEYAVNPPDDKRIKFSFLNPDWIICNNIDFDHPDVYSNIQDVKKVFFDFLYKKKVIINIDDKNLSDFYQKSKDKKLITTYGFEKGADFQILNYKITEKGTLFTLKNFGQFKISLYGLHNVYNATAVIAFLNLIKISPEKIRKIIVGFFGAKRRFELINNKNFLLFDDYAHHPKEIKAVLSTAKQIFKDKKISAIFQPHTFSRTQAFLKEFGQSLDLADKVYLLPIFASARENPKNFKISSLDLVNYNKKKFKFFLKEEKLINYLKNKLTKNDVLFTLGAGDIYKVGLKLLKN